MKLLFLSSFLVLLGLTACQKAEVEAEEMEKTRLLSSVKGTYNGTFQRVGAIVRFPLANVSLTLTDSSFSGSSDHYNYPAICSGTVTALNNELKFSNNCAFTADFDWSLILSGNFKVEQVSDTLKMWKEYENGTKDIYLLRKAIK